MPDREKVINDLQDAVNDDWMWRHADYYALTMERAIALLKEQEVVEPKQIVRKQCKTEHSDGSVDYYAEWFCPHCNSLLKRGFDATWIEYCFKCGKPITWEGR